MTISELAAAAAAAGLAATLVACSSDSDDSGSTDMDMPAPMTQEAEEPMVSTATITLQDGRMLSTEVECVLEPHSFEDQPLLYRATMDANPRFNVAQADEGASFEGTIITWDEFADETTGEVVEAWGGGPAFATDFASTLSGSTITGSGTLVEGGPDGLTGVEQTADLEVLCAQ